MRKVFESITLFIALLFTIPAFAQTTTIFVKIIDANGNLIKGESADANHKDEIIAVSYGQDNTGCAIGVGSCGGTLGNFIFNMNGDKSLPLLNQALFTGTPLRSVDMAFRKASSSPGQVEYFKVHLETVSIVHVTNSLGDAANAPLLVQVALSAAKAGWTYTAVRSNGQLDSPVKWGWDAIQKQPWSSF